MARDFQSQYSSKVMEYFLKPRNVGEIDVISRNHVQAA